MGFLAASWRHLLGLSAVWWSSFFGLDVRLVSYQRDLGWLVFPRPAEEVFDRHASGPKHGLVFVFIVILAFKAEVCTFKQINSRI